MNDPGLRRDDLEVVEGALAPTQEGVALTVPLELALSVRGEGLRGPEGVDLYRVIHDHLGWLEGVDLPRVTAERPHRIAHRGEIDDGWDASEVLHQDSRWAVGDLHRGLRLGVPVEEGFDVARRDALSILMAQEILEEDSVRQRESSDVVPALLERAQASDLVCLAPDFEGTLGLEAVLHRCSGVAPA